MFKKRKHRRKIQRRKRGKKRQYKRIGHLDAPISNKWTKTTTYLLIIIESIFIPLGIIWFLEWFGIDGQMAIEWITKLLGGWF